MYQILFMLALSAQIAISGSPTWGYFYSDQGCPQWDDGGKGFTQSNDGKVFWSRKADLKNRDQCWKNEILGTTAAEKDGFRRHALLVPDRSSSIYVNDVSYGCLKMFIDTECNNEAYDEIAFHLSELNSMCFTFDNGTTKDDLGYTSYKFDVGDKCGKGTQIEPQIKLMAKYAYP